ncbi:tetratricopeptide repeat protein [bacterium]|nr:tetratricopeptide repeat protein [bacterium]
MVAFLDGREFSGREQQQRYLKAIDEFDYAQQRGMPEVRRDELTYALGVSLQNVGLTNRAREVLEQAYDVWPAGRTEITLLLVENYRTSQKRELLDRAILLLDSLADADDLTPEDRSRASLLKSDLLNQVGRRDEAMALLGTVPFDRSGSSEQGIQIFRAESMIDEARGLLAQGKRTAAGKLLTEAQEILQKFTGSTIAPATAAHAQYQVGVCTELLDNGQAAITHYQNTIRRFDGFDEAFAARVRLALVFQREGRNEEAIRVFRQVHSLVPRPEDFRNSLFSLTSLRTAILDAAEAWRNSGDFAEAITLCHEMPPVIERAVALKFAAQFAEQWAEAVQQKQQAAPADDQPAMESEVRKRWSASGAAWAELAREMRTTARYPEYLKTSAEHYRKGHDFETALVQCNEFIRAEPPRDLPNVYVLRGKTLMDLDRLSDALSDLQFVVEKAPTNAAAFEAQYLIGVCLLEMNLPDDAERAWQTLLNSNKVKPSADEWRRAMFSLSRLLVLRASDNFRRSQPKDGDEMTEAQAKLREAAYEKWQNASRYLDEYLRRYPESPERIECRYLLASSLHKSSLQLRERLTKPMPTNARTELRNELRTRLNDAAAEYRRLQRDLQSLRANSQLDAYGQELYRNTFLEIPHIQFDLPDYDSALDGYRTVATRFPDHVSTLRAYLQMARCYNRKGEPEEARRQLEQARVILRRLPDEAFKSSSSGLSRDDWAAWIDWARQVQDNRG